ncbi:MAG: DUF2399 domain-containing protein [Deltaproteobacteria bacterium]|nr:DUF2399 domain-containing protein [Deltaproteobacteria bacterium]
MSLAAILSERVGRTPGLQEALSSLLTRSRGSGRLPRRVTLEVAPEIASALRDLFSARACVELSDGRVRLELSRFAASLPGGEPALLDGLREALGEVDASEADRLLRRSLKTGLLELLDAARHEPTRSWLGAVIDGLSHELGEELTLAQERGLASALEELGLLVRAMDALLDNRELMRVQRFSALALGSSKALRWGSDRFLRLTKALYDHSPETRRRVLELGDPHSEAAARALALEAHGVYRDVAAASALCFGALTYRKGGEVFGDVARHAARGDCARLTVAQLADAALERPRFERVRLIENLTSFLDYVDALVDAGVRDELVICTGGQASWAVVRLLRLLAPFRLDMACACDLDRSGVLIWRSLMQRGGVRLRPWHLDAGTLERWAARGQPLSAAERSRLEALVRREDASALGHDLLRALLDHDVWVEQEAFSDETLLLDAGR